MKNNSNIALHILISYIYSWVTPHFLKLSKVKKKKTKNNSKNVFDTVDYTSRKIFVRAFPWCTRNSKRILLSPTVMKHTFQETTYSPYFLLFKNLFPSWKYRELFFFVQLPLRYFFLIIIHVAVWQALLPNSSKPDAIGTIPITISASFFM